MRVTVKRADAVTGSDVILATRGGNITDAALAVETMAVHVVRIENPVFGDGPKWVNVVAGDACYITLRADRMVLVLVPE